MVLPEFIRTIYHEVEIHESGAFEKLHFGRRGLSKIGANDDYASERLRIREMHSSERRVTSSENIGLYTFVKASNVNDVLRKIQTRYSLPPSSNTI